MLPVNVAPDGGEQRVELIPEGSVAFKTKLKTAEDPLVGLIVWVNGQITDGACESLTETLKLHELERPP